METSLLVHGGAGDWAGIVDDPSRRAAIAAGMAAAAQAGWAALAAGGSALDAVQIATRTLEDDPLFNAGRGAALDETGRAACDAALHDGWSGRVGAVACLRRTPHPIDAARAVLDDGRHALIAGPEAEAWLHARGVPACDAEQLITSERRASLARWRAGEGPAAPRGTVGAVARDGGGRLAAATSTGGLTGKRAGRIGDSPLPGAGTWADRHAAISCTGHGEAFIQAGFALRCALGVAGGLPPAAAGAASLAEVARHGGDGGAIVLAADGRWAILCSSAAIAWSMAAADGCRSGLGSPPAP